MATVLEVIAFDIQSCAAIEKAGAQRIELCMGPQEGGTTPSKGFIKAARAATSIDLYPIIRPRGGDFLYSDAEFRAMTDDVQLCKDLGCDGVVIGLLTKDGDVDETRTAKLVEMAYPMEVTFHRAFDRVRNVDEALETVIRTGCTRILTSGFKPAAPQALENLKSLIQKADDRIIIMPGSGVRSTNIIDILSATGATEIHSSARKELKSSMAFVNPEMNENLSHFSVNEGEVRLMAQLMRNEYPQQTS